MQESKDAGSLHETLSSDGEVDFEFVEEKGPVGEPEAPKKRPIGLIVGGLIALVAVAYGVRAYQFNSTHVVTDDAYITTDVIPVNVRVQGIVQEILIKDNESVRQGQPLVKLDDASYQADLAQAEANLAMAQAAAGGASTEVGIVGDSARAKVAEAEGGMDVGVSDVALAKAGVARATSSIGTALAALRTTEAESVASASLVESRRAAAQRVKESIKAVQAQIQAAEAGVAAAQASLDSSAVVAENAEKEAKRARMLANGGSISVSSAEANETAASTARSAVQAASAQVASAQSLLAQRRAELSAVLEQAKEAQSAALQSEAQAKAAAQSVEGRKAQLNEAKAGLQAAVQAVQASEAKRGQAQARLQDAQTAPRRQDVSEAARRSAAARVKQAEAALLSAKLALSRTLIKAPVDGVVSRRSVQIGQQVSPAQPLMAIIPSSAPWIVANFKETQIERLHPGLTAEIHVDAYPQFKFKGTVESISRGTGATFALLPPDNATGNFTKVVQRVPVKIVVDPNQKGVEHLKAGLSTSIVISLRS